MIDIFLNSKPIAVEASKRLSDILETHQLNERKGIAVALNNKVITRDEWKNHLLKNDDRITVIQATQGG